MNFKYFKGLKILDGGMGQELHARGLVSKGTLWSTSALLDKNHHQLIINTHLDYIHAGADIILTNTFSSRRIRMKQNKVNHLFEFANKTACELALKAREISKKNILIAGCVPAQFDTYKEDLRDQKIIYKAFDDQIKCLNDYIDFFYLDVLSSGREIEIATKIIDKLNKPILVGLHLLKNGRLPSGETIKEVKQKYFSPNWIGVIASCVSIEIAENSINELEILNLPFGYKVNLWGIDEPLPNRKINTAKFNEDAVNLNTIMGKRQVSAFKFLQLANKFIKSGATILGGCCETDIEHIKMLSKLKKQL